MKDIVLRVDESALAILQEEVKKKRTLGVATSIGDKFLIRFLEALGNGSPAFLFKVENNKLIARNLSSLKYDDDRPSRTNDREVNGTHP